MEAKNCSRRKLLLLATITSINCGPVWADDAALEQLGKDISEQHCSRCHVVNENNPFGGISSTPSFGLMVNGLDDWQERFASFHTRLPHPSIVRFKEEATDGATTTTSVAVMLEYTHIRAISAYAKTLLKN